MYSELARHISSTISNERENLIFNALERFGITRDNYNEYTNRILVYTWSDNSAGITYNRYSLDNKSIFSLVSWTEFDTDVEHMSYKATYKTKIEFFEEVEK